MRRRRTASISAAVVLSLALAGCAGAEEPVGDKAGGSSPTVTLTLGTASPRGRADTPKMEYFLQRLTALTKNSVKVEVSWSEPRSDSGPKNDTDFEQSLAKRVRAGQLDLGWVGSRAFDTLGATSLQAIQAPFLITDNEVMGKVALAPVAKRMLAGLATAGFTGLGLFPDELRHPVGIRKALASLADFKGARVRTPTSNVSDAMLRALGAEPIHLGGTAYDLALHDGSLDGTDASFGLAPRLGGSVVTGNVVFYPRVDVLFTTGAALGRLDRAQRDALVKAADEAVRHSVEALPKVEDAASFCARSGRIVNASESQLAAMHEAVQPVYAALEADPDTKAAIEAIRNIAEQVSPAPTPLACGAPGPSSSRPAEDFLPNGVYVATATKADALRLGVQNECALKAEGAHLRLVFKDGKFEQWEKCSIFPDQLGSEGIFTVTSDTLTFLQERCCPTREFDWSFDGRYLTIKQRPPADGSPIDPGAPFTMDHRWEKVG